MSEMVEKVARAMWAERVRAAGERGIELEAWGEGPFFTKAAEGESVALLNNIMDEARAAIAAMREPTEAMKAAGATRIPEAGYDLAHDAYVTMIDAALTPPIP